jgi:hypothetical protein
MVEREPTAGAASRAPPVSYRQVLKTILDFLTDFAGEVIDVLRGLVNGMSGNLWPPVLNDYSQSKLVRA